MMGFLTQSRARLARLEVLWSGFAKGNKENHRSRVISWKLYKKDCGPHHHPVQWKISQSLKAVARLSHFI